MALMYFVLICFVINCPHECYVFLSQGQHSLSGGAVVLSYWFVLLCCVLCFLFF